MLKEYTAVRQIAGQPRRWWMGKGLELVIWFDQEASSTPVGFQISYKRGPQEFALTKRAGSALSNHAIDTGSAPPFGMSHYKGAPTLKDAHPLPLPEITDLFEAQAESVPLDLRSFVLEELRKH